VADIKRGYLLSSPGYLTPSYRVDTRLRLLSSSSRSLKNWNRVRFHLGTDEALGRVVLLDRDELLPGEESYAQLVMEKPVVAHKGDPFVIRYYSPVTTIGGGSIIDAQAPKQKRFKEEVLDELVMKEEGSLYDVVLHELESNSEEIYTSADLAKRTGHLEEDIKEELQQLLEDEKAVAIKNGEYMSVYGLKLINDKIVATLEAYHQQFPLRQGYSREDMRSRFFSRVNSRMFNSIIKYWEEAGTLVNRNNYLRLASHQPSPGARESQIMDELMAMVNKDLFTPPSMEEIKAKLKIDEADFMEILSYLISAGKLVKVAQDSYFSSQAIEAGQEILGAYFAQEKELSLATARDILKTSRKYALPLLEHYDRIRFTRRVGDMRVKMG
ncbi:MAG: SelB C-terminal domain-containing protein, partial [Syntrophomonadaceae bacterium]|nr:SelB C-terminal domain-containing protein [Syntrophomonadaceae bacterium]